MAALMTVLGLVGYIEEQTELRIAAEQAAEIYGAQAKVLKDCEQGANGYYYPTTGRMYECSRPL